MVKILLFLVRLFSGFYMRIVRGSFIRLKYFDFLREHQNPTQPITFEHWAAQKIWGKNASAYWPVHPQSRVTGVSNILVGKGSFPGYMPGCYIQGLGLIEVGNYSIFAPNVGIISANHSPEDNSAHVLGRVSIGSYCWIGMNAIVLPGVTLGDFTVVAAGAVVTNSFPEGYCIVGGNPARKIKDINPDSCVRYDQKESVYRGYIPETQFSEFARKHLNKVFHSSLNLTRGN